MDTDTASTNLENSVAAHSLNEAFAYFIEASKALEAQQTVLQNQVTQLSQDLVVANARLKSLLDALPAAVILVEQGIVQNLNPAASELIPSLTRQSVWSVPETWQKTDAPGEYTAVIHGVQRSLHVGQVDFERSSIIQIQDISDVIAARIENQRINQLAAMGKMSAGIAHQLRTPLSTAILYASHLKDPKLSPEQQSLFADRLQKQLMNLEKLAGNMLLFLRNQPQKTEPCAVDALVEEALGAVHGPCREQDIVLQADLSASNTKVHVEKQRVINAIVAILENAIQMSSPGQSIRVQTQVREGRALIGIEDEGPGIADDMMENLFQPFSTNRITGTGLGLSIANNAITSHGGHIQAGNRPNGGARFDIQLPLHTA